ncbi:hypothetical protein [Streptomyces sp. OE57]|uniref:hypothetical protein n=1 Tax=Streptomyces lacaronensis TaxID=3379885 RepID=UPI0039B751EA
MATTGPVRPDRHEPLVGLRQRLDPHALGAVRHQQHPSGSRRGRSRRTATTGGLLQRLLPGVLAGMAGLPVGQVLPDDDLGRLQPGHLRLGLGQVLA